MIISNIDINKNKLEEFVRVLLPEYYEILSENTDKKICIDVNESLHLITEKSSVIIGDRTVKEIEISYEKIGHDYFDQAEVMAKTSLLKLSGKEREYKWGALIGVRPTKIAGRFLNMGLSYEKIADILKNIYFVSEEKIKLLLDIVKRQGKYLDRETIGIYIGVAFCPTKCTYCSFPAYLLKGKYAERYDEYIKSLYRETSEIGKFAQEQKLKINTIYIGGGTPSILSAEKIEKLLITVKENYDLQNLREFTFEAGRIDTLDREKLQILRKYGVDKISINPQSFNEKTLKLVNRYHNREEFDNVYSIAKEIGLKINMDLILGLPGETTEDILHTLEELEKYNPENLTIHNLAIKNASRLNKENYRHYIELDYERIFDKISEVTESKKLNPYYMYRQKNSFQWGENLGYSVEGEESVYNIEMIEENKTVIGIGAGAITKLIHYNEKEKRNSIKRLVNPKDPLVWVNELPVRLEEKKQDLKNLFESKDEKFEYN